MFKAVLVWRLIFFFWKFSPLGRDNEGEQTILSDKKVGISEDGEELDTMLWTDTETEST